MALSLAEVNAVSTRHFDKGTVTEQVYDSTVILDRIRSSGQIVTRGGTSIQFPIRYQKLGDADMVDPDAARVTSVKDTRTGGELDWKFAKVDTAITWEERTYNQGEKAIINLLADKYKEAGQDLAELISTQFHQAYTSKGSLDMDGFLTAVAASSSSYAGIDQDDVSEWNAGVYDTSTATIAMYGTGSIDAGMRACNFRTWPDLMVTTWANASIYASKLQPGERRKPEGGRAGASDLYFRGVPILADPQANTNIWMIMNTEFMYLYIQGDDNFATGPWTEDPDRIKALRTLQTVVGNFVFKRRKSFGAYTAWAS
jgi:hypothetical protein